MSYHCVLHKATLLPRPSLVSYVSGLGEALGTCGTVSRALSHLLQDGGKQLLEGLRCNQTMTEFDLRLAEVGEESEYLISQMLWANRDAARLQPVLQQPAEPL